MSAWDPVTEKIWKYKTIILGRGACSKKVGCKIDEYVENLYRQPAKGEHSNDSDQHSQHLQKKILIYKKINVFADVFYFKLLFTI